MTVLPGHMERLDDACQQLWPASLFSHSRRGVISIAKDLSLPSDFSGCYVLQEGTTPIYVDISEVSSVGYSSTYSARTTLVPRRHSHALYQHS